MSSSTSLPPKPQRRWLQFSLGKMLLGVTLIACCFGLFAFERRKAAEARAALAPFARARAVIGHEPDHSPSVLWQALIGDDPAQTVNFICLEGMTFSESDLKNLATLKQLRRLRLSHTKVSDAGLVHLEKLTQLESLHLWGTNVTESGVKKLRAALPNCEFHTAFDERQEETELVKAP